MSSSEKIKNLKENIIEIQLNPFKYWLNEVLSICESHIEEQMFLQLIYHLQKRLFNAKLLGEPYFSQELEFIKKHEDNRDFNIHQNKNEFNYDGYSTFATIGVSVDIGLERSKIKHDSNGKVIFGVTQNHRIAFLRIKIIPQYEVLIDKDNPNINIEFNPRVDIAFLLEKVDIENYEILDTRKIAIECDGYEFHKKSFEKDRIRERAIKKSGFKDVLRYSGSEIYKTSDNAEKIHYNFKELLDIILS